jgi:hypothetical protein
MVCVVRSPVAFVRFWFTYVTSGMRPSPGLMAWMSHSCRSMCMNGTFTPYGLVRMVPELRECALAGWFTRGGPLVGGSHAWDEGDGGGYVDVPGT